MDRFNYRDYMKIGRDVTLEAGHYARAVSDDQVSATCCTPEGGLLLNTRMTR